MDQAFAELLAQGFGIFGGADDGAGETQSPIGAQHLTVEGQLAAALAGQYADGRTAGAVQGAQHGAFRTDRGVRGGMIERGEFFGGHLVGFAIFQPDGALGRGRGEQDGIENGSCRLGHAKPVQPRHCQKCGVGHAVLEFFETGGDIAAEFEHFKVGPPVADLRGAAQGRGADAGAFGQIVKTSGLETDEGIADVFALKIDRHDQPIGQDGRHVLGAVHTDIDAARQQRFLNLTGEQALAANILERQVFGLCAVAFGANDLNVDSVGGHLVLFCQQAADQRGLFQRQRGTTCAKCQEGCGRLQLEVILIRHLKRKARMRADMMGIDQLTAIEQAPLRILGIETSCDETAAAIVLRDAAGRGRILSNIVRSQVDEHQPFGGVVPELAARAHVVHLDRIIAEALEQAGMRLDEVDGIAATAGPGLIGGVLVGLTTAKALAAAAGRPLIAVNHLEAHALTARLTGGIQFPYLLLLVSGGHSQFVLVRGVGDYQRWGSTIDDALGEAFDKVAKLLGLGYPGGPEVEKLAATGDESRFDLPRPLLNQDRLDFSFSGLKTAVRLAAEKVAPVTDQDAADICAAFQKAVTDIVGARAAAALRRLAVETDGPMRLVVAGGVAANKAIGAALERAAVAAGAQLIVPPPALCTDNGAMVAWAGAERLALGQVDGLDAEARPRWPLDEANMRLGGAA